MKKFITESDAGAFLFGNDTVSFKLPNNYGDCSNKVLLFESETEFAEYTKHEILEFKWIMPIRGQINLYNYDCSKMIPEDIAINLNGSYDLYLTKSIYRRPTLAIVKN